MRYQQTVGQSISCNGVGLHSGHPVSMTLRPAPPDTGIVFIRHQSGTPSTFSASIQNLLPSELCTAIGVNGTHIKTVEHVLSALAGMEVDNVFVDVEGGEIPAMDGSAGAFVRLIRQAGVIPQERRQAIMKITKPIEVVDRGRSVRIEPSDCPRITYTIQYDHPLIQTQTYVYDVSASAFEEHIAEARTFGFLQEVEALWSRGLGKGGSLENTVVLSDRDVINESGLRFQDEFVRHKILDLMGDFALLGVPLIGHLIAERSGHALHTRLVEAILSQPDKWVLLNVHDDPASAVSRPAVEALPASPRQPLHISPAF